MLKKMKSRRSNKTLSITFPILLGLLIPCFFYFYFFNNEKQKSLPNAVEFTNHPLPVSKVVETEGSDVSSKIREGKVLLVFLSSKCAACKKDVEVISQVYSDLAPRIQIEKQENIVNFAKENNVKFPILIDVNAQLFKELQIRYFPTKFLLDDGVIVKTFFGNFPNKDKIFEELKIR